MSGAIRQGFHRRFSRSLLRSIGAVTSVTLFAFGMASGAGLRVSITDTQGRPVPDAVVTLTSQSPRPAAPLQAKAVMDQIGKQFVPNVLVIRAGTVVVFPNSDSIAHQVYSFSPAKRFELPLYRGRAHAPIVFDQAGVIVLGCNIHDTMLGYIVVTETPWFGKSDTDGVWTSDTPPAGDYRISVWSSRLPREDQSAEQRVRLTDGSTSTIEFRLARTLRPPPVANRDRRIQDY
jgi:plastocyanin